MKRTMRRLFSALLVMALLLVIAPAAMAVDTLEEITPNHTLLDENGNKANDILITSYDEIESQCIIEGLEDATTIGQEYTISLSGSGLTDDGIPYLDDAGQHFVLEKIENCYGLDSNNNFNSLIDIVWQRNSGSTAQGISDFRFAFTPKQAENFGLVGYGNVNLLSFYWKLDENTKIRRADVAYDFNLPNVDAKVYTVSTNADGILELPFDEGYVGPDADLEDKCIVGKPAAFYPEYLRDKNNFVGIVGGIPEPEKSSSVETMYRFLGWKIKDAVDNTTYTEDSMPNVPEAGMTLLGQWEKVDLDEVELTQAQQELVLPFAAKQTITYADSTTEAVDAMISQSSSTQPVSWSQDKETAPLAVNTDRLVYYKAELYMYDYIAGGGWLGNSSAPMHTKDVLAGRKILDPAFADFDIKVQLDEHLEVVPDADGNVRFSFICTFLRPVYDGVKLTDSAGKPIPCSVTDSKATAAVSDDCRIRVYEDNEIRRIAGEEVDSTAYTYTVKADDLTDNTFTIHVEWNPTSTGYSYPELLSEISLEVAAAKIDEDYTLPVATTGVITGNIYLDKAGYSESEVATAMRLLDPNWLDAFDNNNVESVFQQTKIIHESLSDIELTANTVYARLPAYDITINYLEKKTNDVLDDEDILTDVYSNTEVDLSEYLDKDIRGYRQVKVEVVTDNAVIDGGEITMPSGDVVINVYYERNPIIPILPGLEFPDGDIPGLLNLEDHYAYIIGYDDGKVKPQNNITRAEVATIFFRLLTDDARAYYWSTDSGFSDVHEGDWYNNAVSTMVQAGILNGYSDGTFRPNANITRGEFATIAARFLSNPYSTKDRFYDTEGHWAEVYINRAAEAGWIDGYPDGSFRPDQAITRAEAVTLVNAVLGRAPHEDHLLPDMIVWPDNPKSAWYYEAIQEATNSHDYDWASSHAYEIWTELLENRQWSKLEKEWSDAYSAPGGEVMD